MADVSFDIIVADGFVLTEVAAVVDALRIANRISLRPVFSWSYRSVHGGPITSSSALMVTTQPVPEKPASHFAVFIGNSNQSHVDLAHAESVRRYSFRGARVVLLAEAAARFIQDTQGADEIHTTHWENRAVLAENMPVSDARSSFAADDGKIITCAGMSATFDMILGLMERHMTSAAVMTVADIFLHDKIRDAQTPQPFDGNRLGSTGDKELDDCILLMQANMEEPLPIGELAVLLNVSNRSLERKFHSVLKTTPNTYYRELRLHRASHLLLNTSLSLAEVAHACGFSSGFSRAYKNLFGVTPTIARKQKIKSSNYQES